MYKIEPLHFLTKLHHFTSELRNFAMKFHPCTETDVKIFKIVFLDPKNLQKDMLQASNVWKLAIFFANYVILAAILNFEL